MGKIEDLIKKYTDTDFKIINKRASDNHFIHQTLTISPSNDPDVKVEVSINDEGDVSIVDSNIVLLKTFNIAEGYSQEDMAMGIAALLSNQYQVGGKGLFGKRQVSIQVGAKKVYGRLLRWNEGKTMDKKR